MEDTSKSEAETLRALYSQLDGLWTQYLDLLDAYTSAQAAIQKHMSSGFFNVAQANFKSTRGRYGQDYYDERAVATTRVTIAAKDEGFAVSIRRINADADLQHDEGATETRTRVEASLSSRGTSVPTERSSSPTPQPTSGPTPEPDSRQDNADDSSPGPTDANNDQAQSDASQEDDKPPKVDLRDPIRWFGILIPPTLRHAQESFSTAVLNKDAITKVVETSRGLREVEVEIRRMRKAIKKTEKTAEVREELPVRKEVESASQDFGQC